MFRSAFSWTLRNRPHSQPFVSQRSVGHEQYNGQVFPATRQNMLHHGVTHSHEPFHAKFLKDRKTVMEQARYSKTNQTETSKDGTLLLVNSSRDPNSSSILFKELSKTQRQEGNRVIYSVLAMPLLIPAFMAVKYTIDPVYRQNVNEKMSPENIERLITSKFGKNNPNVTLPITPESSDEFQPSEPDFHQSSSISPELTYKDTLPFSEPAKETLVETEAPSANPEIVSEASKQFTVATPDTESNNVSNDDSTSSIALPITDTEETHEQKDASLEPSSATAIESDSTPSPQPDSTQESASVVKSTTDQADTKEEVKQAAAIVEPHQASVVVEATPAQETSIVQAPQKTPEKRAYQIGDDITDAIQEIEAWRLNYTGTVETKRESQVRMTQSDVQEAERPIIKIEQTPPPQQQQQRRPATFIRKVQEPIYIEANNKAEWERRLKILKKHEPEKDSPLHVAWEEGVRALERMISSE